MFSIFMAVSFAIYQMYFMSSGFDMTHWQTLWLLEGGLTEMLYSLILFAILFLWRPSPNNKRFAYAQLQPTEGPPGTDEEEFGTLPTDQGPTPNKGNRIETKQVSKARFTISDEVDEVDDDETENPSKVETRPSSSSSSTSNQGNNDSKAQEKMIEKIQIPEKRTEKMKEKANDKFEKVEKVEKANAIQSIVEDTAPVAGKTDG